MTWMVVKLFLKRVWVFLKEYWQIPFMVLWTIITVLLSRRNTAALKDVISVKQESHKKEVEILRKTHKDEIMNLKKIQEQYLNTIKKLELVFKEQEKKLSEKHVEDVKEIVVKSKGNPEKIKRKIEDEFGIKFKD